MSLAFDTAPVNKYALLVTFSWGSVPTVVRYTSYDYDLTIAGNTFTSCVTLEAETSAAQSGTVTDTPWYVRIPSAMSPARYLIRQYPWPIVTCRIEECDPTDSSGTQRRTLFYGQVGKAVANKSGFRKMAQLEVSGIRQLLLYSSGIVSDQQCAWALGDQQCCVDLSAIRQTATITAINGTSITLSSITTPGGDPTYWVFGSAEYDALPLMIRSFSGTTFILEKLVPPEWMGNTVTMTPGDDKFAGTCKSRFNNLSRFGGFGISIPAYHPQFETGAK